MYPHQAFRVGASAWGVQFHPEVSLPTFRAWAEDSPRSTRTRSRPSSPLGTTRWRRRGGRWPFASPKWWLADAGKFAPWIRPGGRRAGCGGLPGPASLTPRPRHVSWTGAGWPTCPWTTRCSPRWDAPPTRTVPSVTLGRLLDAVDDRTELVAALSGDERLLGRLSAVLGLSMALSDHLVRHPEHWHDLGRSRARSSTRRP